MFTGIIEQMGTIQSLERSVNGARLAILAEQELTGVKIGDSIAVNGACLTVTRVEGKRFSVDVSPATLSVTTLGQAASGELVNLERALRLSDRLDGHLVSGHIDGIGRITQKKNTGNAIIISFQIAADLLPYLIQKGSVAVDGISLTVNHCDNAGFSVAVIPHTAAKTTISIKQVGSPVNIETDIIGKYVEQFTARTIGRRQSPSNINMEFLAKTGFL